MRFRDLFRLALLGLLIAACGGGPAVGPDGSGDADLKVLFVGNSLTYYHRMPLIVEAIARANGGPTIATTTIAVGGYSLGDHLAAGDAERALRSGGFDLVVMQQGPSSLPASRVLLREDVARFAEIARDSGTEPAVYQVWAELDRYEVFPDVLESYRLAAEDVHAPLYAVGSAWLVAWDIDPALPLYGPDGFHPSPHAAYLAALVIYEGLSGRSAIGTPGRLTLRDGQLLVVPDAAAAKLQRAAELVRSP